MFVGCWLSVVVCWLLFVGCWLLVVDCWSLFVGCWLLVVGCWSSVVGRLSLVIGVGLWLLVYGRWSSVVSCFSLVLGRRVLVARCWLLLEQTTILEFKMIKILQTWEMCVSILKRFLPFVGQFGFYFYLFVICVTNRCFWVIIFALLGRARSPPNA